MENIIDLLEALTIFCFGLSWPISIRKSWVSRTAKGKSVLFEIILLVGYGIGAAAANLLRFVCSFLSGIFLWGSYAPEGQPVWLYSLTYNGGYMIPNAIVAAVCLVLLCALVDPKTLRPMKKGKE